MDFITLTWVFLFVLISMCMCFFLTEGQEVKVGEYNAIADVLDLINNSIRFQGMKKAGNVCMHLNVIV